MTKNYFLKECFMKKIILSCLGLVLVLSMISCVTPPPQHNVTTQNMANPNAVTEVPRGSYTVLGPVSGSGSVTHNTRSNTFTGDTFRYGSLGSVSSSEQLESRTSSSFFGLVKTTETVVTVPTSATERAIGNANYAMIDMARGMNADAIIFVNTTISTSTNISASTVTTTANVSGVAVRLDYR